MSTIENPLYALIDGRNAITITFERFIDGNSQ